MLITLTAVSGGGKSKLKERLLGRVPGSRIQLGLSSRPLRNGERFPENEVLPKETILARQERGESLWTEPAGKHVYAMAIASVKEALQDDGIHRIMILLPNVMPKLYEYAYELSAEHLILPFFIRSPGEAILRQRMLQRGDAPEEIESRIRMCETWESEAELASIPYIFVPDNDLIEEKLEMILSHLMRSEPR